MMLESSSQTMDSTAKPSMFQFPQVANDSSKSQCSPTPSNGGSNQENNYHQYHEALDPTSGNTVFRLNSPPVVDRYRMNSPDLCAKFPLLNTVVPAPPPQTSHQRSNIRSTSNVNVASICDVEISKSAISLDQYNNMIDQDTNDVNTSMKKVLIDTNQEQNIQSFNQNTTNDSKPTSSHLVQQNSTQDVSEDIYLCYVTLKSRDASSNLRAKKNLSSTANNSAHLNQSEKYGDFEKGRVANKDRATSNLSHVKLSESNLFELRHYCIRELLETESNYVKALEMIIDCFARPLEKFLRREDAMLIFNHIKQFQRIHTLFYNDLIKTCQQSKDVVLSGLSPYNSNVTIHALSNPPTLNSLVNVLSPHNQIQLCPTMQNTNTSPVGSFNSSRSIDTSSRLSSCFLHWKDKFVLYGDYCATLSKAQTLIDELCLKNEQLAVQIERCQHQANEGKFKLRDLLSLPMQRILKYHLLLSQLIKNTPTTHEDYHDLKRAHDAMMDLGQYINEVKRDTEALQIINDIQSSINELELPPDTQLVDYGRLVKDGELKVKSIDDSKVKSRYVFVFDKVILMCKLVRGVRGEQYSYKEALVLNEYDIEDNFIAANPQNVRNATKDKWSHHFRLVKKGDKYIYTFFAKTLESKNKWLEDINKAMDNSRPEVCRQGKTNHAFLMHTFDRATNCDYCSKLLYGRYYQGYRCQVCFLSAHKQCLTKTRACGTPSLPPRYLTTKPLSILNLNEPPSPSIKSDRSDDSNNVFHNSNVNPIMERYSNISENNAFDCNLLSPRPKNLESTIGSSRDLTSDMIVSLQNTSNNLIDQRRMLSHYSGSKSTSAINQLHSTKVIALESFDGLTNEQLTTKSGDVLIVYQTMIDKSIGLESEKSDPCLGYINKSKTTWWVGKNLRTGREGHFPSHIIETYPRERKRASCGEPQHTFDPSESDYRPHYGNVSSRGLNTDDICNNLPFFGGSIDYVNCASKEYPWFLGQMDRDGAQSLLENTPHETFLVRNSPKQNGCYVISLNYNGQVKHMRVHVTEDNQLFLSQTRYFKSLVELVSWYERNSLMESFHLLDARLVLPYKGSDR